MTKLTARHVAVLRRLSQGHGWPSCSTWIARGAGISVRQAWAACRYMEGKGLVHRSPAGSAFGVATSSGVQWLRSLDAGRPWMIRGPKP